MDGSPHPAPAAGRAPSRYLGGIMAISLAAMVTEISLTRVFSLLLYYHFTFLVVGLAMLGLSIGGLLVWLRGHRRGIPSASPAWWGLAAGLATTVATLLVALVARLDNLAVYTLLSALPFVAVGGATSSLLALFPRCSGRIYAADLAGAAAGALLSVPILGLVGGYNGLLVAGALMGWGGWLMRPGGGVARYLPLVGAAALSVISAGNAVTYSIDVDVRDITGNKTMGYQLQNDGRVVFTRWDGFARTDVVSPAGRENVMYVYIDGSAGSVMVRFDGNLATASLLRSDIGFYPFRNSPAGEVLDIGPGGGMDVLLALVGGASRVTAVEVNPGTVEAVRHFSDFNGGIYDRPDVEAVVDEGRAYLQRSGRSYDTIYLSLAMTQNAERGGYALTENYLYTIEAVRQYLDHLKPGGQLVFLLHDQPDVERLIRTVAEVLLERGVPPEGVPWYMLALSLPGSHGNDGGVTSPLLIVRRDAYTPAEAQAERNDAVRGGLVPLYMPGEGGVGRLAGIGIGTGTPEAEAAEGPPALLPTTDDRPFFYVRRPGPPQLTLVVAFAALSLAAAAWWLLRRTVPNHIPGMRTSMAYFGCLGVAFMVAEVALLQRLTLFLGHPTLAVTTVLFTMLLGGGVGSWLSGRAGGWRWVSTASAGAAGLLVAIYALAIEPATAPFISAPTLARVLIAAALVAPLGVVMGMPFPSGLRTLAALSPAPLSALAWSANGFASVLGSALAVAVATVQGFTASLLLATAAYVLAAALGVRLTAVARKRAAGQTATASAGMIGQPAEL